MNKNQIQDFKQTAIYSRRWGVRVQKKYVYIFNGRWWLKHFELSVPSPKQCSSTHKMTGTMQGKSEDSWVQKQPDVH